MDVWVTRSRTNTQYPVVRLRTSRVARSPGRPDRGPPSSISVRLIRLQGVRVVQASLQDTDSFFMLFRSRVTTLDERTW